MYSIKKQLINDQLRVKIIEDLLKEYCIIDETTQDILNFKLNKIFPNPNKDLVYTFEGKIYGIIYSKNIVDKSLKVVPIWKYDWFLVL